LNILLIAFNLQYAFLCKFGPTNNAHEFHQEDRLYYKNHNFVIYSANRGDRYYQQVGQYNLIIRPLQHVNELFKLKTIWLEPVN